MEEKFPAKYVKADVFKHPLGQRPVCSEWVGFQPSDIEIPGKGNGRPGEIKGKILLIHDDFHDMRIEPIPHLLNPCDESGHLEGLVGEEGAYRFINNQPFDQWFVPLDIDDDF